MICNCRHNVLPEPVPSPHQYHLFNRNSFGFGQEDVDEDRHHSDPTGEEEEDAVLQAAEEGEKRLRDYESEKKVHCYCDALSGRSSFQREYLARYCPT